MAHASDSSCQTSNSEDAKIFDMGSLRTQLPQNRRGLSRHFSGKSQSYTCLADVKCLEDLKKPDNIPEAKRKKYSDSHGPDLFRAPSSCRRAFSSNQCAPCIDV